MSLQTDAGVAPAGRCSLEEAARRRTAGRRPIDIRCTARCHAESGRRRLVVMQQGAMLRSAGGLEPSASRVAAIFDLDRFVVLLVRFKH